MTRYLSLILILFYVTCSLPVLAESWRTPTWGEILANSKVIAIVEFASREGDRLEVKINTLYKGPVGVGEHILLSGFRDELVKMGAGDKFLVFLKRNLYTAHINKKLAENSTEQSNNQRSSYRIWTPLDGYLAIKGDSIQYELSWTSFYHESPYYPLDKFDTFLNIYLKKKAPQAYFQELVSEIGEVDNQQVKRQHILQLYLLGYKTYHEVFAHYLEVKSPYTKSALAKLMGNIKTENSRMLLTRLLDDPYGLVQVETVKQLKNEPPELAGPTLLTKLRSSYQKDGNLPRYKSKKGRLTAEGQSEIIKTFGEWRYKPALSELLLLLETRYEHLFKLSLEAVRKIGTREHIPYLNKHLDNKTYQLVPSIANAIARDSLTVCLPSLKRFISTSNRDYHYSFASILLPRHGLGRFEDPSTVDFLLADFKHFLTYKDTLSNSNQREWALQYFKTFAHWRTREARPLIFKYLFDWMGINLDFAKHPELFFVKQQAEESLSKRIAQTLADGNYQLSHCTAFIKNTKEVIQGHSPQVDYLIEVIIPRTDQVEEQRTLIANKLGMPKQNIYFKSSDGQAHNGKTGRYYRNVFPRPLMDYLKYAKAVPHREDLELLTGMIENQFFRYDYEIKEVRKAVDSIRKGLGD